MSELKQTSDKTVIETSSKLDNEPMLLRTEVRESYNHFKDEYSKEHTLSLSTEQIRSGLIAKMLSSENEVGKAGGTQTTRNFAVLLVIAAHMDAEGKSFPSQKKIAELTGMSRYTVARAVKELSEITVGGKPIVQVKKEPNKLGHEKTVYYFNGIQEGTSEKVHSEAIEVLDDDTNAIGPDKEENVPEEPELAEKDMIQDEPMNSRQILELFMAEHEKAFGIAYVPNYARDLGMIKQKLAGKFSNEDLIDGISVAVSQYSERWATRNYQFVTVGMLCSWLFNEAIKVVVTERNEIQQVDERAAEADKFSEDDILNMLDM